MEPNKQEYLDMLSKVHNDDESYTMIERLINKYFLMIEHMKKTSLYDVYDYEKRITELLIEPTKILTHENVQLKREVNNLRKQLKLSKKYKD